MFRSWKIGTAFGIGVFIHPTFWILPLFVMIQSWGLGAPGVILNLMILATAMGCVVLHEYGHALTARYFGVRTRDITLYPIGGVARLERLTEKPIEELLIALAGPAVNVVIAGLLFAMLALGVLTMGWSLAPTTPLVAFLEALLYINGGLVLFNLIPAFPMDGGRVLRALLAMPLGRLRATEVASTVGIVMAVGIGLSYLVFGNPMLILVAGFVILVGQQELAMVRYREARRMEEPIDVLPVQPILYDVTGQPIRPGFSGFIWNDRIRAWVQWRDGRPVATFWAGSE
jgi:Zn-dependent protease